MALQSNSESFYVLVKIHAFITPLITQSQTWKWIKKLLCINNRGQYLGLLLHFNYSKLLTSRRKLEQKHNLWARFTERIDQQLTVKRAHLLLSENSYPNANYNWLSMQCMPPLLKQNELLFLPTAKNPTFWKSFIYFPKRKFVRFYIWQAFYVLNFSVICYPQFYNKWLIQIEHFIM